VLVIGGGGREHALVWGVAKSPKAKTIFCAPGNAGIGQEPKAQCVKALDTSNDQQVVSFCKENGIDLAVVGPEAELVSGLADDLRRNGIRAFGPSSKAAQLEGSKTFMKDICEKYGIPTAKHQSFTRADEAKKYIRNERERDSSDKPRPIVVKADGLAAGKGVVLAETVEEACDAVDSMLLDGQFGSAGESVVVEEYLTGEEASFFVIVDSEGNFKPLHSAQDHKAAYDGDKGPNTGGMGAYSPAPIVDRETERKVMERIISPLVKGLEQEGCAFQGVIFAGLMVDESGDPKVLEFNVRFGDPECEVLMYRLQSDLLEVLLAACDGRLDQLDDLQWLQESALVVIMAAQGYPGSYQKGTVIQGEDNVTEAKVFHANTSRCEDTGNTLSAGGRVLAVTAKGKSVKEAQEKAYKGVDAMDWPQGFCRRDIGWRAIGR
jgi:phosphoribosylamine--glycine ligase